jgi:hypothetical protein
MAQTSMTEEDRHQHADLLSAIGAFVMGAEGMAPARFVTGKKESSTWT